MSGIAGKGVAESVVEEAMREAFPTHKNLRIKSLSSKIIGEGKGFVSSILRLSVDWEDGDGVPDSLILKVPTAGNITQLFDDMMTGGGEKEKPADFDLSQVSDMVPGLHLKECQMYDLFAAHPPPFPTPKTYKTQPITADSVGFILMEDLGGDFHCANFMDGLNEHQLGLIADFLADLTVWSVREDDAIQAANLLDPFTEAMLKLMEPMTKVGFAACEEQFPDRFGGRTQRIAHLMGAEELLKTLDKATSEIKLPKVVSHGDTHLNNIIFTKDSAKLRAVIDWQISRPNASVIEDFCRLFVMSVPTDVRRKHSRAMLERYQARVEASLPGHISMEQLEKGMALMEPVCVGQMISGLPGILKSDFIKTIAGDGGDVEAAKVVIVDRVADAFDDVLDNYNL